MEDQAEQPPLKVCRHCSAASRTAAGACPSCGKPYARRIWRWWLAIPIVALAFAGGYGGRKLIEGDDSGGAAGITAQQGREIPLGISPPELEERLDEQPPGHVEHPRVGSSDTCLYYLITDRADSVWEFCFSDNELVTSRGG